ncbi:hypothetical protein WDZ16_03795 [Pseudokineococcus marinus]|uniref:Uncharacterized protein n=1 Tax=Pseudokineococcus marinus TaxID=351215 RepID=A0A849BKM3_9ACTN|nr:hypothetical protein [Pseudokineococcus marinus]NNH21895.1 hypothetical protein [Pseudokineococcus marinus]
MTGGASLGALADSGRAAGQPVLPPSNVFTKDVSRAPVDRGSAAMVDNLEQQVTSRYGGVAAFNVYTYGASLNMAGSSQRRVDVRFDDCQGKGWTPRGLFGPGGHFEDVPIPADAVPAAGTDGQLTVYSPSTDQLWEFWKARKTSSGWSACWGGRIDRVSRSTGAFPSTYGASASGLASSVGAVRIHEAERGDIDHALSLSLPRIAHWGEVSYPATRSDGSDQRSSAIPMGTRFRLDPAVDVDRLGLHPVARAVAEAAQTYGFIVTDTAGAVAVTAESGEGAGRVAGKNPWYGILDGTGSYAVMAGFPWDRLQVIEEDWGAPR